MRRSLLSSLLAGSLLCSFLMKSSFANESILFSQPSGQVPAPVPSDTVYQPFVNAVGSTLQSGNLISVTTGSAYAAGNCIGTLQTSPALVRAASLNGTGVIFSATVTDPSAQAPALDIIVFNSNPTSSTFTNQGTCSIANADKLKVAGVIHVTDWTTAGISIGQALNSNLTLELGAGVTSFYYVLVSRATPTFSVNTVTALFSVFSD